MVFENLGNPQLFSNIFKKTTSIKPPSVSQINALKESATKKLKVPIVYRQKLSETSTSSLEPALGKVELMTPEEFKKIQKEEKVPLRPSSKLEDISKSLAVKGASLTTKGFSPEGNFWSYVKSPYQIAGGYALEAASAVPEAASFLAGISERAKEGAKIEIEQPKKRVEQPDVFRGDISKKAEVEALKNIGFIAGAEAIKPISTFVKSSKFKKGTVIQKPVFEGTVYTRKDLPGVSVSEFKTTKPQIEIADFLDTRPDILATTKEGKVLPAKIRDFSIKDISFSKEYEPSIYEKATAELRKEFLSNSFKTGKPSPFVRGIPKSDIKSMGEIIEKGIGEPKLYQYYKKSRDLKVTNIKNIFPGVDVSVKQDFLGAAGRETSVFTRKPPKGGIKLTQKGLPVEKWVTSREFAVVDPEFKATGQIRTKLIDAKPVFYENTKEISKLTSPDKDVMLKLRSDKTTDISEKILGSFGEFKKIQTSPLIKATIIKPSKVSDFIKSSKVIKETIVKSPEDLRTFLNKKKLVPKDIDLKENSTIITSKKKPKSLFSKKLSEKDIRVIKLDRVEPEFYKKTLKDISKEPIISKKDKDFVEVKIEKIGSKKPKFKPSVLSIDKVTGKEKLVKPNSEISNYFKEKYKGLDKYVIEKSEISETFITPQKEKGLLFSVSYPKGADRSKIKQSFLEKSNELKMEFKKSDLKFKKSKIKVSKDTQEKVKKKKKKKDSFYPSSKKTSGLSPFGGAYRQKYVMVEEISYIRQGQNIRTITQPVTKIINELIVKFESVIKPELQTKLEQKLKTEYMNLVSGKNKFELGAKSKYKVGSESFNKFKKEFMDKFKFEFNSKFDQEIKEFIKQLYLNKLDKFLMSYNGLINKSRLDKQLKQILDDALQTALKNKYKFAEDVIQKLEYDLRARLRSIFDTRLKLDLKLDTLTELKYDDELFDIEEVKPRVPDPIIPKITEPEPPIPKIPRIKRKKLFDFPKSKDDDKLKIDEKKAYKPYVRTKGKWTEVKTKVPVNFYEAKKRAFTIADKYAERSAKLVPTNKKAKIISRANPLNSFKFRSSKSKKKSKFEWVEKSKFAIDSKTELDQITYKGLKTIKNRSSFL